MNAKRILTHALFAVALVSGIALADLVGNGGAAGGAGGTCGVLGGDLSGTCAAATVAKVNGVAVGSITSLTGNGAKLVTGSGAYTTGHGLIVGATGNVVDSGSTPGTGTLTGTGTTGLIPDWTSASALGDSTAYRILVTNDTVTGTANNKLVKFTSAGKAIITSAAETAGILGIVHSGAAITGSAVVTTLGAESCVSDNATTAGHYATISASTAGDCSDTGAATFPASGTQVIGIWTETGVAGTRAMFFNTPDVSSVSSGGGGGGAKNPGGAAGDVQYRATGNNFAAESNLNYNATTNYLTVTNGRVQSTMTTTAAVNEAALVGTLTGYTGTAANETLYLDNTNASTGNTLNLGSTSDPAGAMGTRANTVSNGGLRIGQYGTAGGNTLSIGVHGKAGGASNGESIGVLGNAFGAINGTGLKNVGVYGTLSSSLLTTNGSFAGLFDGGTLPDESSQIIRAVGILPASPASTTQGYVFNATGAGSASQSQWAIAMNLLAGYTGSSQSIALRSSNQSLGTGNTPQLNANAEPTGNIGIDGVAGGIGTGLNVGLYGDGANSTGTNVGSFGKAVSATAGTNIGGLFNASSSTEATNLKNIAGWFTLDSTSPAAIADNVSVTLAAASDGTADIFRGYSTTTKKFFINASGDASMAGIAINGALTYGSTAYPAVSTSANIASTTRGEDCTSGASAITRTLPAATGSHRVISLTKVDSGVGTCIFGRTGSDALNGGTTRTLSAQFKVDHCYDQASALWICTGDGT